MIHVKDLASETFHLYTPSNKLSVNSVQTMKNLSEDSSIFIITPDKGDDIVLLNKLCYDLRPLSNVYLKVQFSS